MSATRRVVDPLFFLQGYHTSMAQDRMDLLQLAPHARPTIASATGWTSGRGAGGGHS